MGSESDNPYLDRMIEAVADDWFIQGEYDESEGPVGPGSKGGGRPQLGH